MGCRHAASRYTAGVARCLGRAAHENRPERWPNRAFRAPTALVAHGFVKGLPFRLDAFYAAKYDGRPDLQGESGKGKLLSHSLGFQVQKPAGHGLDYGASLIGQTGGYGADRIRALGANTALGVTLPWKWRPRLAAQFTWGSGDRDSTDGVRGTFDGVFGGADINFYGDLNLFFWANLRNCLAPCPKRVCPGRGEAALTAEPPRRRRERRENDVPDGIYTQAGFNAAR
ncbi:MAG: hypothetical protein FJW35_03945 [Acidobacteria bacterium]|nr:hypothetical protein [Acidobacteriota bacterium]